MNLNMILEQDLGYPHVQGPLLPAGRLEKVRLPTTEDDICNKDRDSIPRRNTSTLLPDLWVHPTPIPPLRLMFPSLCFHTLEIRKRSYWTKTKRRLSNGRSPEPPHTQGPDPFEPPLWQHALRPPLF